MNREDIRVGQIFEENDGLRYVVTKVWIGSQERISYIDQDGEVDDDYTNMGYDGIRPRCFGDRLIAEYPTWQEAVNSKEFKGE